MEEVVKVYLTVPQSKRFGCFRHKPDELVMYTQTSFETGSTNKSGGQAAKILGWAASSTGSSTVLSLQQAFFRHITLITAEFVYTS